MHSVTPGSHPLSAFDGLVDHERSRAFHAGRRAVGLATMEALVEALGPALHEASGRARVQRPDPCVHVAGSEGKTSVTEQIAAGLSATGRRVGTYTSPHLRDPAERLRIGGVLPDAAQLRPAVEAVCAAAASAGLNPSWFESLTATALVLFSREGVDAAVWETGLGGRLDATRVLPADLCVLTTISLEHTAVLGDTLAAVAREKAGILRPGVPLVCGRWIPDEALDVVRREAERLGCLVHLVHLAPREDDADEGQAARGGAVDVRNRALSVAALDTLADAGSIDPAQLPAAHAAAVAQRVEGRDDLRDGILFDGAHTVAAVIALALRLADAAPGPVLLGATSGRDAVAMAAALLPVARPLVLTRAPGPRGMDPAEIAAALPVGAGGRGAVIVEPDPRQALAAAQALLAGRGVSAERSAEASGKATASDPTEKTRITVTGSLHLVGLLLPPGPPERNPTT